MKFKANSFRQYRETAAISTLDELTLASLRIKPANSVLSSTKSFFYIFPGERRLHGGRHVRVARASRPRHAGGLRNGCGQDYAEGFREEHVHQEALQIKLIHNLVFRNVLRFK